MTAPGRVRIVIAEDQAMVMGALAALLRLEPDLEVAGTASSGDAALDLVQSLEPDVLLSDIEMPGMSGLELAAAVARSKPTIKVVLLTTFDRPGYVRRAMDQGVAGFLLKDTPAERLAESIRIVHRGGRVIDPALAIRAWETADPLSERERQVLRLAGEGKTSGEIAKALSLTSGTVRNYLSDAIGKLNAANRVEAARIARQKGFL